MKIKTKTQKNKVDDEKRISSLKEKLKAKQSQQNLIKTALSNIDQATSNKKLKFESDDDGDDGNAGKPIGNDADKLVLFDESSDENEEDYNLSVKKQFKGKEGLKLLELQSTYGDDDRFKIDERFIDEENSNDDNKSEIGGPTIEDSDKICTEEEKNRQLEILGDVLGKPVLSNENLQKAKKRTFDMVRYDASNEEHSKFLIQPEENELDVKKKKKEKKQKKSVELNNISKPVSKEKFYEVSSSIKEAFESAKTGFSLLQTFGRNNKGDKQANDLKRDQDQFDKKENKIRENYVRLVNSTDDKKESSSEEEIPDQEDEDNVSIKYEIEMDKNPVNSTESKKLLKRVENTKKDVNAQGVWKESFFFKMDDPRFKEGLDFINKKNSNESKSALETFDSNRGKLREVFRTSQRKHKQKNNPFKKKVGGMKIKGNKFLKSRRNGRSGLKK